MAIFSAFVVTVGDSVHSLRSGVAGEAWGLSGMSLGLAVALLTGLAVVGLMSYAPALMQRALHFSVLGSAAVLAAWSATSMVVALAARSLPGRLATQTRLVIGLALAAAGEVALSGLGTGTSWPRLVPGLLLAGVGSGIVNAAIEGWNVARVRWVVRARSGRRRELPQLAVRRPLGCGHHFKRRVNHAAIMNRENPMISQLYYLISTERHAEFVRVAERARRAQNARPADSASPRGPIGRLLQSRRQTMGHAYVPATVQAFPMPTAHPAAEAYPAECGRAPVRQP